MLVLVISCIKFSKHFTHMLQTECVALKCIRCNPSTRYEEEGSLGHVCRDSRVLMNGMSGLIWRCRELAPFHWSLPYDEKMSICQTRTSSLSVLLHLLGLSSPQNWEKQMHVHEVHYSILSVSLGWPCCYILFNPQNLPAECRFWFCFLPWWTKVYTGKYIS